MTALKNFIPSLTLLLITLLSALPWGLSAESRFFLPLLPAVAIHYWQVRRPEAVPVWLVFVLGILLDVSTGGPLGYWSLIYLIAFALAALASQWRDWGPAGRLIAFLISLALLAGIEVMLASVYFAEWSDWAPRLRAYAAGVVAYLVMALIFRVFDSARDEARGFLRGV
jgi:rod shape-determining protein MreD